MPDVRALSALAERMGADLGMRTPGQARASFNEIDDWDTAPTAEALVGTQIQQSNLTEGALVLSGWRELLDDSRALDGAGFLLKTTRPQVARVSAATAAASNLADGQQVVVSVNGSSWTGPLQITDSMADGVVWVGLHGRETDESGFEHHRLVARPGTPVVITAGQVPAESGQEA
jgi:NADH-quinone oxidoreductase subunit G